MTKTTTLLALTLLLTGCGADIYNKPGGTQADLDRDIRAVAAKATERITRIKARRRTGR